MVIFHCYVSSPEGIYIVIHILLGGLEHDFYDFPIILGISSSQLTLTPSFFQRGRYTSIPPTSNTYIYIYIYNIYIHIVYIYIEILGVVGVVSCGTWEKSARRTRDHLPTGHALVYFTDWEVGWRSHGEDPKKVSSDRFVKGETIDF